MSTRLPRCRSGFVALLGTLWLGAAPTAAQPKAPLSVQFSIGAGMGDRSLARPLVNGQQRIEPAPFPAAALGLEVVALPAETFSLGFLLRYQTTIYDTVWEHPPNAPANEVRVRSHHVELGIEPTLRGSESGPWAFGLAAGYSMRVFWPDVHNLHTPRQVLMGPFLRPELMLRGLGPVSLRLGPELFWILTIDPALQRLIGPRQGFALGVQGSLIVALGANHALEIMYRESHAVLVQDFADVERFLTLSLTRKF